MFGMLPGDCEEIAGGGVTLAGGGAVVPGPVAPGATGAVFGATPGVCAMIGAPSPAEGREASRWASPVSAA